MARCGAPQLDSAGGSAGFSPSSSRDRLISTALTRMIESGPISVVNGVVRWRLVDLCQWVFEEVPHSRRPQTMSRELHAMGYRKLSARPRHYAQAEGAIEDFKKVSDGGSCESALVARFGELSQQPTWPQVRQRRRYAHGEPIFRHSSQPSALPARMHSCAIRASRQSQALRHRCRFARDRHEARPRPGRLRRRQQPPA
jgi:Winged helix-turn helix